MSDIPAGPMAIPAIQGDPASLARSYWGMVWQRLRYDYVTFFCVALIILIILSAVFAPWLAPMDPDKSNIAHRLKPIGYMSNILGTDEQGRDVLSRMLWGGRISLTMGILPVFIATVMGGIFGTVAGYYGGKVNMVIMRLMDVFFAFPSVLLAVALSGTLGGGTTSQLIALSIVLIPPLCRVAETATSQVRNRDFVDAARASGASTASILFNHVLINVMSPVLVYASSLVSISIILASGLSFLGLGASPPTADWGMMISTLRQSIYVQPVVAAIPGVAIFITSIAFHLVSDGLRQAMDVRT